MSNEDLRRPDDDSYAEQLIALGKTADCPCDVDVYFAEYGKRKLMLRYVIECPVHYPATASVLRGEHPRQKS